MDRDVACLVKQDLVVTHRSSPCFSEVFRQALSVGTNSANDREVELAAQFCEKVIVGVPTVHSYVAALDLVSLGNIGFQALDDGFCRPLDIILVRLSHRLPGHHMYLVRVWHLGIVERTVEDAEFPGLPC